MTRHSLRPLSMHFSFASNPLRPVAAVVLAICALAVSPAVRAAEPFTIADIRIEGLQRTDPGTVFASLPFRIGDTNSDDKGAAALRALFATGLFKDVRIEIETRSGGGGRRARVIAAYLHRPAEFDRTPPRHSRTTASPNGRTTGRRRPRRAGDQSQYLTRSCTAPRW
jgi:hypothetical protein